jgi:UDP-glucose:(glucosyl)LPS alpha-1,2-glucosyltransferase
MTIEFDDFSKYAKGGTEIIKYGLLERLPKKLLSKFQIVTDRFDELDETKIRLYWSHLDPDHNEQTLAYLGYKDIKPIANGGWNKFHRLIFVSHYQMENWIREYDIPRSHCVVMKHALIPIEVLEKPKNKIVLVHHSNPQRGLSLLVDVFEKLCEEYDNIELKVHSSWKIYGMNSWEEEFENNKKSDLYERLEKHPKIKNIGYLPNDKLKKSLASSHIFPYPNIMPETFCLSLLEAMSAGCLCVHPNFGCLPETASNWTMMYPYHEKIIPHEERFYQELKKAIEIVNTKQTQEHLKKQKEYVDYLFNWERRTQDWIELLQSLENLPLKKVSKSTSIFYQ